MVEEEFDLHQYFRGGGNFAENTGEFFAACAVVGDEGSQEEEDGSELQFLQ